MKKTTLKINTFQNEALINMFTNKLVNTSFEWLTNIEFTNKVYENSICVKILQKLNSKKYSFNGSETKNFQIDFAELCALREILKGNENFYLLNEMKIQVDKSFTNISQMLKYSNSEPQHIKKLPIFEFR